VPDSRSGPSYFVHGPDLLIDTPEEARLQLNRAGLDHVPACIYSHWHPDHTLGSRVFEMNLDFLSWPKVARPTDIYLPEQVAADMRVRLGLWEQLTYMQSQGIVRLHELRDGETINLNGWVVRPFRLHENYVYAFLIEGEERRALIAPDELYGWQPPAELCTRTGAEPAPALDVAVLAMGLPEFHPLGGERLIPTGHPVLRTEATFAQTLDIVRQLHAPRVVLSHIEETCRMTHDDFLALAARLQAEGLPVTFAYDTMRIDV
jgi:phosphoribosyl 1,2-cyclic phosphate phosphodiesterase